MFCVKHSTTAQTKMMMRTQTTTQTTKIVISNKSHLCLSSVIKNKAKLNSDCDYENSNQNNSFKIVQLMIRTATKCALFTAVVAVSVALCVPDFAEAATQTKAEGSYADPNHPGCPREIDGKGVLRGFDPVPFEKGRGCRGRKIVSDDVFQYPGKTMKYWEIKGEVNESDTEIFIDFDSKDGSGERVIAKILDNGELEFADGGKWTRRRSAESFFP